MSVPVLDGHIYHCTSVNVSCRLMNVCPCPLMDTSISSQHVIQVDECLSLSFDEHINVNIIQVDECLSLSFDEHINLNMSYKLMNVCPCPSMNTSISTCHTS